MAKHKISQLVQPPSNSVVYSRISPESLLGLTKPQPSRVLVENALSQVSLGTTDATMLYKHADLSALAHWHCNDMLVDHDGRAWVGNFGFDLEEGSPTRTTVLICVDPNGTAKVVADELGFPNGMVLTPDGLTLIVAESMMNRLSAFNVTDGSLGARRTWATFGDLPTSTNFAEALGQLAVAPDRICLDAEGAVWVVDAVQSRLIRVDEGGRFLEERKTDGVGVFACMLRGDDGRTLFACVAPTFHQAQASANHQASILMTTVEVPHAGLP